MKSKKISPIAKILYSGLKKAEIEDDGIQAILNAVDHENSNIRKIYLWGNNVSLNENQTKNEWNI